MSAIHETCATLRIIGEDLDPDEISALLGQPPTSACRKGDIRFGRDGREYRERFGAWRREIESRRPGDLEAQVEELLSGLTEDLAFWNSLSKRYQIDAFSGLFMQESNEGITISAKTLLALGARGIELDLDIYGALNEVRDDRLDPS